MNKYILLVAVLLTGCGGSSSTPIAQPIEATEPVEVTQPIVEVPQCPEVPECPPCPIVVEPEPIVELYTYYQIGTGTLDGVATQINTYDENGTILSRVDESTDSIVEYEYDSNGNIVSLTRKVAGVLTYYIYYVYDNNSNLLEQTNSTGRHEINTYENNQLVRSETDTTGDGEYNIVNYTWSGDDLIQEDHVTYETVYQNIYDIYGNIIYKNTFIKEELVKVETWTWQEFTEEI